MKNKELFDLKITLDEIIAENYNTPVDFKMALIQNKKEVESKVADLKEAMKPSEGFLAYDKERIDLLKKCSVDEEGELQTKNIGDGNLEYLIQPSKMEEFKKEIEVLKETYKVELENQVTSQKEIEDFLNKDADNLNFSFFDKTWLHKEFKTTHFEKIFDLIKKD